METINKDEQEKHLLDTICQHLTGTLTRLPIELIIDILSRLPTKTLFHCNRVSKSFRNLITHPRFTLSQHLYSITSNTPSIILRHVQDDNDYLLDYHSLNNLTFQQRKTPTLIPSYQRETIVGSSHGLLLLKTRKSDIVKTLYSIANPITGERIDLRCPPKYFYDACSSGFGFDISSNMYKVLNITRNKEGEILAEVLAIGYGCYWREIPNAKNFFNGANPTNHYVFVGGAFHWLSYDPTHLTTFALATEKFGQLALPTDFDIDSAYHPYLGVLEEKLCLIDNSSDAGTRIWVLQDYGVEDSWKLRYFIDAKSNRWTDPVNKRIYVLLFVKNGEIVVTNENHVLGYYDLVKEAFRPISVHGINPNIRNLRIEGHVAPFVHIESLISPKDIYRLKKRLSDFLIATTTSSKKFIKRSC